LKEAVEIEKKVVNFEQDIVEEGREEEIY